MWSLDNKNGFELPYFVWKLNLFANFQSDAGDVTRVTYENQYLYYVQYRQILYDLRKWVYLSTYIQIIRYLYI